MDQKPLASKRSRSNFNCIVADSMNPRLASSRESIDPTPRTASSCGHPFTRNDKQMRIAEERHLCLCLISFPMFGIQQTKIRASTNYRQYNCRRLPRWYRCFYYGSKLIVAIMVPFDKQAEQTTFELRASF